MHFKFLLLCQLLALCSTRVFAQPEDTTISDVTEVTTITPDPTTTQPEVLPENKATAVPDAGLEETTSVKATADATAATALAAQTTYPYPQPPRYPHPYAQPYPYPGAVLNPLRPEPAAPKEGSPMPKPTDASYFGYPNPSYPNFRPPYSPYGPVYPPNAPFPYNPGFAPGQGFGYPPNISSAEKIDDETKSNSDKDAKSINKSPEEATKLPEQPNFGYPPVYFIPRRPIPSFPFGGPVRGYSHPFGYGG